MSQSEKLIQSVERSLNILDALAHSGEMGSTLGEISKEVCLNSSTVHHLLNTLSIHQVVEQDQISKRYRLGVHLIELGNSAMVSSGLARFAQRYIERLWDITEQGCSLLVFHGLVRTPILGMSGRNLLSAQRAPLSISTLHATGSGKVLLSYLPEPDLQDYLRRMRLERFTAATLTDPEILLVELHKIRNQRHAQDFEEYSKGIRCIAAPIQDSSLRIVGCLDLVFPAVVLTETILQNWISLTCQCAQELSNQLREVGLFVK